MAVVPVSWRRLRIRPVSSASWTTCRLQSARSTINSKRSGLLRRLFSLPAVLNFPLSAPS